MLRALRTLPSNGERGASVWVSAGRRVHAVHDALSVYTTLPDAPRLTLSDHHPDPPDTPSPPRPSPAPPPAPRRLTRRPPPSVRQRFGAEITAAPPSMDAGGDVRTLPTSAPPPIFISSSAAKLATEPQPPSAPCALFPFCAVSFKSLSSRHRAPGPRRVDSRWRARCIISATARTRCAPLFIFCENLAALSHFAPMPAAAALTHTTCTHAHTLVSSRQVSQPTPPLC